MALRFNKLVRFHRPETVSQVFAEHLVLERTPESRLVFMSHKTDDWKAEREAEYIVNTHRVMVYMAEWDDNVDTDSDELPDYIMTTILDSDGFLVNVTAAIAVSMWIGYEIGGAHAMQKPRARIMYNWVNNSPTVVRALERLRDRGELDEWICENVL